MQEAHKHLVETYIHKMTSIFTKFGEYSPKDIDLIVDYGRKITYTRYYGKDIGSFGYKIWRELEIKRPDLINGDTRFYFGFCRMAGEYIALDKPEIIDQTLSGVYREIKK